MKNSFLSALREKLPGVECFLAEPMYRHTSFKVGGPADIMLLPEGKDIAAILLLADNCGLPLTVVGNGSNLLVKDTGIPGIVLKVGAKMGAVEIKGNNVRCEAGASLAAAANAAAGAGLAGLEFAAGIPGSVGGGVYMNAGAYDGEMKDVLTAVEAVTPEGEKVLLPADKLGLSYRHSVFSENSHIITKAIFSLVPGEETAIRARIADFNQRRWQKQPLDMPSAGSTFKRPKQGYASCLIDEAGLKGLSVGGAQVSEKHAGFIVNKGNATAEDILRLIEQVQERVKAASGIDLQPEVRILG